jgi:hypothetical protein
MMDLKAALRSTVVLVLCTSLSACAAGIAHENFKKVMDRQIGKNADDPGAYLVYYKERRIGTTLLPNGDTEEQYRAGREPCRVYFRIDKATRKIINWRYEGSEQDCVIVP